MAQILWIVIDQVIMINPLTSLYIKRGKEDPQIKITFTDKSLETLPHTLLLFYYFLKLWLT